MYGSTATACIMDFLKASGLLARRSARVGMTARCRKIETLQDRRRKVPSVCYCAVGCGQLVAVTADHQHRRQPGKPGQPGDALPEGGSDLSARSQSNRITKVWYGRRKPTNGTRPRHDWAMDASPKSSRRRGPHLRQYRTYEELVKSWPDPPGRSAGSRGRRRRFPMPPLRKVHHTLKIFSLSGATMVNSGTTFNAS